jgi:hypothetical protein
MHTSGQMIHSAGTVSLITIYSATAKGPQCNFMHASNMLLHQLQKHMQHKYVHQPCHKAFTVDCGAQISTALAASCWRWIAQRIFSNNEGNPLQAHACYKHVATGNASSFAA